MTRVHSKDRTAVAFNRWMMGTGYPGLRPTLEGQTHDTVTEPLAPVLKEFFAGGNKHGERADDRED